MYKIADNQTEGRYFWNGHNFKNHKEIIDALASYHDIDYEGVKDNDEPYADIYEFLKTLKNDKERLNWLLEYGDWTLEKT